MKSKRDFNWVASSDPRNEDILSELDYNLSRFYSSLSSRTKYNQMIKGNENGEPLDEVTKAFLHWFEGQAFQSMLEVGCGTGRIRQHLPLTALGCHYTGSEVSENVIESNKQRWPDSTWVCDSIYHLSLRPSSFDMVCSFYVLEHLAFPLNALESLYSLVKHRGTLCLIFPDFTKTKRFPSQFIGLSYERSAKAKLKSGKIFDALVSLYDSKIRLKGRLNQIDDEIGSFMVNTTPICLDYSGDEIWSDYDAVYVANKKEIAAWAKAKQMEVEYPFGVDNIFSEHAFMVLKKKI